MANSILSSRYEPLIGKLWVYRFVRRIPELKMCFSRPYNYQRSRCEDSKLIEDWFQHIANTKAKYSILDCDIWNFDETGFMIDIISSSIVVTQSDWKGK